MDCQHQARIRLHLDDPFTFLIYNVLDTSAFTDDPGVGLVPDNAIGDLAVGLDYTLFASGLGQTLDPGIWMLIDKIPSLF